MEEGEGIVRYIVRIKKFPRRSETKKKKKKERGREEDLIGKILASLYLMVLFTSIN